MMLVVFLFVAAIAIAVVLGLALRKPRTIHIVRSTEVRAPIEKVFGLIQDLHAFNTWNPWAKMDPAIEIRYRGPQAGMGAVSAWESRKVGTGSMEIVEVDAPKRVGIRLDFIKPFAATNRADFVLSPTTSGTTNVRWEMEGPASFVQRVMGVFFDVEAMMGKNFEDGLADLRKVAE